MYTYPNYPQNHFSAVEDRSHFLNILHITFYIYVGPLPPHEIGTGHASIFFHRRLQKAFVRKRPRRRKKRKVLVIEHCADVYRECAAMHRADMWYTRYRRAF